MGAVALLFSALRINVAPFSCAMYALCRFWKEQLGHGRVGSRDALLIVLAFAMGCLAGDYAVNDAGTKLVGNDAFTAVYGGRAAYLLFVNCCFAGISVLIGACFCLVLRRVRDDDGAEIMVGSEDGAGERLKHALLGRGFNEVQIEVVLDIVSGKTSPEIAARRYMSRGTVNSARTAAYKALGVHSRSGLIAALSELQGL